MKKKYKTENLSTDPLHVWMRNQQLINMGFQEPLLGF